MASKHERPSFPSRLGTAVAALALSFATIGLTAPAALAACAANSSEVVLDVPKNGTGTFTYVSRGSFTWTTTGTGACTFTYTGVEEVTIEETSGGGDEDVFIVVSDTSDLPDIEVTLGSNGSRGFDRLYLRGLDDALVDDVLDATELDINKDVDLLRFEGRAGDDVMIDVAKNGSGTKGLDFDDVYFSGGDGFDTIDWSERENGVDEGGSGSGPYRLPDDVEKAIGSPQGDKIKSSPEAQRIEGGGGNDELYGFGGADTLLGQAGDDTLDGGDGNDTLVGGNDAGDIYIGGAGTDTVSFNDAVYGDDAASGKVTYNFKTTGSGVENIIGSSYVDWITGNDLANRITGLADDDILKGGKGADSIDGGLDDDVIEGGAGEDVLDGSLGVDIVSYESSPAAVNVNLANAYPTGGDAAGDLIGGFEGATGSDDYGDTLTGTAGANTLSGLGGNDLLVGLGGADKLYGGNGVHDRVSYAASSAGVTVSLLAGAGKGGDAEGDVLSKVEDIIGSAYADILMGNNLANVISGGEGNDKISGGLSGDTIDGGAGTDTISYADAPDAVTVGLRSGTSTGGDGADRLTSIENVIGSKFADTINGSDGANVINGGGGDDTVYGLGGNDSLFGGTGSDLLNGGDGNDKLSGGGGGDRLIGGTGTDGCNVGPGGSTVADCEN